jgi:hypothetical protein
VPCTTPTCISGQRYGFNSTFVAPSIHPNHSILRVYLISGLGDRCGYVRIGDLLGQILDLLILFPDSLVELLFGQVMLVLEISKALVCEAIATFFPLSA